MIKPYSTDWPNEKLLFRLANNKSVSSRWDYISVLRSRPSEELFLKCKALTESAVSKNRIIGIAILAQLGLRKRPFLKQTLKLFFELLCTENDPKVVETLLYGIGHNSKKLSQKQIEKVCSFAVSYSHCIRQGVVSALIGIENSKAIETLIKLSADRTDSIRDWATFGIGTQTDRDNGAIRQALWNRVQDKHQDTRMEAILGLASRKDMRVWEIIRQELIKGDFGTLVFEAIIETGESEFLPLLQQNLEDVNGNPNINTKWVSDLTDCIAFLKLKD